MLTVAVPTVKEAFMLSRRVSVLLSMAVASDRWPLGY